MKRSRTSLVIIAILVAGFFFSLPAISAYGQWVSGYGGPGYDIVQSIQQTSDEGYIVAGYSDSFGAGANDVWIMKLDSAGGVTWQKTYGGAGSDVARSVHQTADGGYVVAGHTRSFGASNDDAWVMKLDSVGAVTWQKRYGGPEYDFAYSIQQTQEGGYIVGGYSWSSGAGGYDAWVMKLDSAGTVTWYKTYGGADAAFSIQQTSDEGYVVAGYTDSFGAGNFDVWIMKLDSAGGVTWQKTYGGAGNDWAKSIQQTQDGGYIVAGSTNSFGAGSYDFWVMKLDSAGVLTWQKTYGESGDDRVDSIQQTQDGGYVTAGSTDSFGAGNDYLWVMKTDGTGALTWQKLYGGSSGNKGAGSIRQTLDGGYILGGGNYSSAAQTMDAFILNLDNSGTAGSCPFEKVLTAAVSDTTVTGALPGIVSNDTAVTGVDTAATVSDASASARQWCPLAEDAQRLKAGVTRKKKGEGSIVSAEGLIACPGTCQEEYNMGLTVTLYADPSDLSTFLGWKPASPGCEGTDPCQVTMDKKKSVKAVFQGPNKLKVVTTFKNEATGTVTSGDTLINCPGMCEQPYILNAPVTLTASAGPGSTFVKWTGTPCKDEPTNVCTFEMTKNITVKAIFEPTP